MNKELDELEEKFRNRPLEKVYPVLWADALYENIRGDKRVVKKAVMVVKAINMDGKREIIAIHPMLEESKETYSVLFNSLKERGLEKVHLVISDAHKGLKAAVEECFIGASWQRCKVHFMRNILARIPQKQKEIVGAKLKVIWQAATKKEAEVLKNAFVEEYEKRFPEAIKCLEEGFEDSVQFYAFDKIDPKKISSSNALERVNEEIRRRTKVVGIFPSDKSYIRLVTTYLIEYTENWLEGSCYVKADLLKQQIEDLAKAA